MSISQLARTIKESPTLKLNQTAARLKDKGEPIIHLGGGEPKSKAPIDAVVNCATQLNTGDVKYAPADGLPDLKKAIIRYMEDHYHHSPAPHNVVVSSGAKQSIMILLYAILEPKEEVVFPAPYWVSYPEMVKLAGGVPVVVTPEDGSFQPKVEEIAEVIGPYTKAVILNSPNNPCGVMYSSDFVAEVVELCEKKGLYLILDDLYNRLVFEMYAMTGFRIGWAILNSELAEAMTNIQSHQTSGPATPSQWAAVGALNGMQSTIESLRLTLENNRNVMVQRLKAFEGIKVTKPDGTFYCFPDFRAYEKDSQRLAQFLLEKVRVVTVPGKEFGMEGHLRLSFCGTLKDCTEGVERIQWALDPEAPNEIYLGERKLVRDWK